MKQVLASRNRRVSDAGLPLHVRSRDRPAKKAQNIFRKKFAEMSNLTRKIGIITLAA
jgi:hypothetical protein